MTAGHRVAPGPLPGMLARLGRVLLGPALAVAAVLVLIGVLLVLRPVGQGSPAVTPAALGSTSPEALPASPTPTGSAPPARSPTPARTPTPTRSPTPTPSPAVTEPALLVLNNSRIQGLAARAAADFRAGGWPVAGIGNLRGRIAETTVYYPAGELAAARALAARFRKVRRVLPRLSWLPGSGLTVVVTRDYLT